MGDFATRARDMGVNYIGSCCGSIATHVREMARALGKLPAAEAVWQPNPDQPMSETEFQAGVKKRARDVKQKADGAGLQLPANFALGFEEYSDTLPPDVPRPRRVLIAAADRDERLYLRAKLSLADLTQADEAESAAEALELARDNNYVLAVVDFALPGSDGWKFLREFASGPRPIGKVVVTANRPSPVEYVRAWFSPLAGFFGKPPHPDKLHEVLLHV